MSEEQTMRLAAEVVDKFSGPLRAMKKQMHALSDELKQTHVQGSRQAREHAVAHGRLSESLGKVKESVTASVIPALTTLGITTLTVSGAITGIIEAIKGLGSESRNFTSLSRQTKIAASELNALMELGRRIGVPTEQMSTALARVGDVLAQIKRGAPETMNALHQFSGDIPAFIQSIRDLKPAEQIQAILDITTNPKYPVDQRKRLLAFFGLPENIGNYLTTELQAHWTKAKRWADEHPLNLAIGLAANEAFTNLRAEISGLRDELAVDFAPGLTQLLSDLTEWMKNKENVEGIKSAFHEIAGDALVLLGAVKDVHDFLERMKVWGDKQKEKPPGIDLPSIVTGKGLGRSTGMPAPGPLGLGWLMSVTPAGGTNLTDRQAIDAQNPDAWKTVRTQFEIDAEKAKSGKRGMMDWIKENKASLALKAAEWGVWGAGKGVPHLAAMGMFGDLVTPALAVKALYDETHSHDPAFSGDTMRQQRGGQSPRQLLRKSLDDQYKTPDAEKLGIIIGTEAGKKIVEELKGDKEMSIPLGAKERSGSWPPGVNAGMFGGGGLGGSGGGGGGMASLGGGGTTGTSGGMGGAPGGPGGAPGGGGPLGEVGPGGAVGDLAGDRAKFAEELKNPAVRDRLAALTKAEVGNQGPQAQQAFTEMVMNFASSRKKPLADSMRLVSQGGMFPGLGNVAGLTAEDRKLYGSMQDAAMGGSNLANFATGNASKAVGFNKGYEAARHGGERFGVEGPDRRWAERMKGAVGTTGGIAGIDPHSMDPMAPRGAGIAGGPYGEVTTGSGRKFKVAAWAAPNFQKFVDSYEAAGGVLGPNTGTLGTRPGNRSYHPLARAMDLNQTGRGVRGGGVTLPRSVEDRLAEEAGLWPGSRFGDAGHFEARNRAFAIAKQKEWAGPDNELMKNARGAGWAPAAGAGKIEGDASLSIDLSGFPRGTRTKTKFGGLFKKVTLNRGRTMPLAGEGQGSVAAGEEEPP